MTNLNQIDLNVRLQLAGCKYSELANTYANNLKYRLKCAPTNLANLLLLNALIEILECYTLVADESGLIEKVVGGGFHVGWTLEAFSGGVSISGPIVLVSNNPSVVAGQIADAINAYQDDIVASYLTNGRKAVIFRLVTPCDNPEITLSINTGAVTTIIPIDYTREGVCAADRNCFTEEEIQTLIDKIAKVVKLCYQPIGFDYEVPEGYTLNEETGELTKD